MHGPPLDVEEASPHAEHEQRRGGGRQQMAHCRARERERRRGGLRDGGCPRHLRSEPREERARTDDQHCIRLPRVLPRGVAECEQQQQSERPAQPRAPVVEDVHELLAYL